MQEKVAPSSVKIVMPLSGSGLPDENLKTSELGVRSSVNSASGEASAPTLKKDVNASGETSRPRVYLLGENRWEEPDRLASKNMNSVASRELGEQCFSCKGQGRTMCTECEGTGELNVEEQFLEWAEEGAKCPYCEGNGVIDCDVCAGSGLTPTVRT
ncbi:hypothetical protein KP509_04G086900 [Ceratopteris richardii]|uniref:Uncharacterized protein n=1 Tax=Ceratopteris richardii TaxID=49495 RepID=A0A8T2UZ65_CERRI|nr:hypothetical protein KP509_04G086900 [Ceratopteris richardii]